MKHLILRDKLACTLNRRRIMPSAVHALVILISRGSPTPEVGLPQGMQPL
jgi:hypothetical protein